VDTGATEAAVRASLADWAEAWSGRRIDAYLGHYAATFRAQDGQPRAAWEQQRRQRIGQARDIRVRMENLTFLSLDAATAEVRFTQHYRASNYAETSRKTVRLAREADGAWRIISERTDAR
jgi:adhesin transport system outer membrane protein